MFKKFVLVVWGLCCLLGLEQVVQAQDVSLSTTVTHIAGANVYLDVGTNHGVATGDTLRAHKGDQFVGMLHIISSSSKQSVVEFVGKPFAITRASRLTIVFSATPSATVVAESEPDPASEPLPQATVEVPKKRVSNRQDRIKLRGRLLVNFSMLGSETKPQAEGLSATRRTFVTPSLNLNTTVSNLPSGIKLRLNIRSDYRYNSRSTLTKPSTFRAYQLSIEKDLPFGQLQFGRFHNRLSPFGGYWDGASLMYGSRKKGIGASLGFMPDRSNEGFTTQFPRFSGFAHFETARKPQKVHYRISASYHEVQPSSQYLDHRFVGFEQTLNWGPVSFNQDLQLDRDPITTSWVASLFQANTRIKVTDWLNLRGRYAVRQPYRMYNIDSPISLRRDQIQGGLNVQFLGARIGVNYSTRYTRRQYESRTYTAYFNTPLVTPAQVTFFGSGNQWKSDYGTALYLSAGVSKPIGKAIIRADYGFYRSTNSNQIDPIDLSRYTISGTLPFSKTLYWNMRTSLQQSQFLRSLSLNTSLQYRF